MESFAMADTAALDWGREISSEAVFPVTNGSTSLQSISHPDLGTFRSTTREEQEQVHQPEHTVSAQVSLEHTSNEFQTGQTSTSESQSSQSSSTGSHASSFPSSPVPENESNINSTSLNGGTPPTPFGGPFDPAEVHLGLQSPHPQVHKSQLSIEFKTHREEALLIIERVRNPADDDALIALR